MCVDLTAVDYLAHPGRRAARRRRRRSASRSSSTCSTSTAGPAHPRCASRCPADDPTLPTLFDLHPGTEAMEREVYDMFGIVVHRPPRPHPHPHARGLGGPPAAQGLRRRRDPRPVQGRAGLTTIDTGGSRREPRPPRWVGRPRHDARVPSAPGARAARRGRRPTSCCARSGAVLRMSEAEAAAPRRLPDDPDEDQTMIINMGPQHPSTHGVLRLMLELQGETVLRCKPIIGYLHTGHGEDGRAAHLPAGRRPTSPAWTTSARSSTSWCSPWPSSSCSASTRTSPSGRCGSAC